MVPAGREPKCFFWGMHLTPAATTCSVADYGRKISPYESEPSATQKSDKEACMSRNDFAIEIECRMSNR